MGSGRKLVAVAVTLSDRNELTAEEKLSLKHLDRYLGNYDRYLVMPEHLAFRRAGYGEKRFDLNNFGSIEAHSRLLFSKSFYESFTDYRYVLVYHLDALVFSDGLVEWCEKGYDYIAPPWVRHSQAPYAGNSEFENKVGNGGFSLRSVDGFMKVITSRKLARGPMSAVRSALRYGRSWKKYAALLKFPFYFSHRLNGVRTEMENYFQNEDHFWANRGRHFYPEFKIAPIDVALQFAFECVPRHCYELNHGRLPFGCHAWQKYDRGFWEKFILAD